MTDEEKLLRSKFYLAPNTVTLDKLKYMNEEYTAYPGLTKEQANKVYNDLKNFKLSLDNDNIGVWIDGVKKVR